MYDNSLSPPALGVDESRAGWDEKWAWGLPRLDGTASKAGWMRRWRAAIGGRDLGPGSGSAWTGGADRGDGG